MPVIFEKMRSMFGIYATGTFVHKKFRFYSKDFQIYNWLLKNFNTLCLTFEDPKDRRLQITNLDNVCVPLFSILYYVNPCKK